MDKKTELAVNAGYRAYDDTIEFIVSMGRKIGFTDINESNLASTASDNAKEAYHSRMMK